MKIKICGITTEEEVKWLNQANVDYAGFVFYEPSKRNVTLEQAKEKYPEWYRKRIVEGKPAGRWYVKRDLYDWWIRKIQTDEKLSVGHRYFCIAVLASYAVKCGVSEDELRQDAYGLLEFMNTLQDDFTVDDVESALNFYQESFITFPRHEVEVLSGLDVPPNKRNGLKQKQHLYLARRRKDDMKAIDLPMKAPEGRPKGSGTAKHKVREWQQLHPEGKKVNCIRDTGLSKPTVYKWWNQTDKAGE